MLAQALFLQVVQLKTSPDETEGWVGMNYEQWINDLRVGGVTRTSGETASNVHREQFWCFMFLFLGTTISLLFLNSRQESEAKIVWPYKAQLGGPRLSVAWEVCFELDLFHMNRTLPPTERLNKCNDIFNSQRKVKLASHGPCDFCHFSGSQFCHFSGSAWKYITFQEVKKAD